MLPSIVSRQVEQAIRAFLSHAFEMNSPLFMGTDSHGQQTSTMQTFLDADNNLSKGPYLSIHLPYKRSELTLDYFSNLNLLFIPYQHQAKAYQRLTSAKPLSTLIATGTGSGKTECFMNPILDYCASHKEKGIKAIIIYPMNALATDQAKRFAKRISANEALKNKVTVGLFIGQEGGDKSKIMTPESVITCKDTLRENPPDILMTNYKMLDFMLLKPVNQPIWKHNNSETLQFLVVDELHTFDGAQGTDLSCLIRRLKHRLAVPTDYLTCIGTSATLGDNSQELVGYATKIFDSEFDPESVVPEYRYLAQEYLADFTIDYSTFPAITDIPDFSKFESLLAYVNASITAWFPDSGLEITADFESDAGLLQRIALGDNLKKHRFFHRLLEKLKGNITLLDNIGQDLLGFMPLTSIERNTLIESFCVLISVARKIEQEDEQTVFSAKSVMPLLQVRYQLWIRELRRMVASVNKVPLLTFSDDLTQIEADTKYLPILHCRDCHATGWGGVCESNDSHINDDPTKFYRMFFDNQPEAVLCFPVEEGKNQLLQQNGYFKLCQNCLYLNSNSPQLTQCEKCGGDVLLVYKDDNCKRKDLKDGGSVLVAKHSCPFCQGNSGLDILGSRAASLISVMSYQLFGSYYNEDKKLITFSDSVQDAAHKAGFFTARTFPLLMRSLIAKAISTMNGETVTDLVNNTIQLATSSMQNPKSFVGNFIAADMDWQQHFKDLRSRGTLPENSKLPKNVENRLSWEVISELGLKGFLARSLVRTGFAAISFSKQLLDDVCEKLHTVLCEEVEQLFDLELNKVKQFIIQLLHLMVSRGAIHHWSLKSYISDVGETFNLNRNTKMSTFYFMPKWGKHSRKPRFISFKKIAEAFDYLNYKSSRNSPYVTVLNKSLLSDEHFFASDEALPIFTRAIHQLEKSGLLKSSNVKDDSIFGLDPEVCLVSSTLNQIKCDTCSSPLNIDSELASYWINACCLVSNCRGHYGKAVDIERNIRWDDLELVRINGAEHTGLLDRTSREEVEKSFIGGRNSWDVNLLSATPTLEMGIDIGDLSSIVLCSVPPAQSNYLQRIGRAGRRDGNAFNITFAEGNPHDLYYYQSPLDMMAGSVPPPGVFLNANAVLERQLTAFCFDSWVRTGIEVSQVPKNVQDLLNVIKSKYTDKFPYTFFNFVIKQQVYLFEQFSLLLTDLSLETKNSLQDFLKGDNQNHRSLSGRILNRLTDLVNDRNGLDGRVKSIDAAIRKLKNLVVKEEDHDKNLAELNSERAAIQKLKYQINKKKTFNFFTDEGLLPNYAFPEEGVTIRSILWRKKASIELDENGSSYHRNTYDYERPAASALSELAPDNCFYAGGHKVEIEQVDLSVSTVETWRVCNNCSFVIDVSTGDDDKACRKCGSVRWDDNGQKIKVLKLRQVYARTDERDAKISDDSDNREPKYYKRQMLINHDDKDLKKAYKIDSEEVPFGFDFVKKINLKDINFGLPDNQSEKREIAGDEDNRAGFKVCNKCGMVKSKKNRKFKHDITCLYKNDNDTGNDDENFIECLYLYRELTSEAIRIVLPVLSNSTNCKSGASFTAGIQLGIKHYFKGNIDHIKSTIYDEPINEGEGRRYYLVIYDTVPGGTGYLKSLMVSPDKFLDVIDKAYNCLADCECNNDVSKDGCYQCIYAYRDRHQMPKISRDVAKNLFKKILDNRNNVVEIESLKSVDPNALLESELESKFIDTLRACNELWKVSNAFVKGKNGYVLTVSHEDKITQAWEIELQVTLDESEGVSKQSRADFVFWPVKGEAGILPIAVFLDGYKYHYNKVSSDTEKRLSIVGSNKFIVWTLYWDDLEKLDSKHIIDYLQKFQNEHLKKLFGSGEPNAITVKSYHQWNEKGQNKNSFILLTEMIKNPLTFINDIKATTTVNAFCWLNSDIGTNFGTTTDFESELSEYAHQDRVDEFIGRSNYLLGGMMKCMNSSDQFIVITVGISREKFNSSGSKPEANDLSPLSNILKIHICFDDRDSQPENYKKSLIGYWKLFNIIQLLPDVSICTSSNLSAMPEKKSPSYRAENKPDLSLDWQQVIEETIMEGDFNHLAENVLKFPIVGYELVDDIEVIGMAELAWEEDKLAVFCQNEHSDFEVFKQHGWDCYFGSMTLELAEKLKEKLGE